MKTITHIESESTSVYQILSKSDDVSLRYCDITIFQNSGSSPSGIFQMCSFVTWPLQNLAEIGCWVVANKIFNTAVVRILDCSKKLSCCRQTARDASCRWIFC